MRLPVECEVFLPVLGRESCQFSLKTVTFWHSCGSRDLSLGLETSRDSFFKVLVLVFWVFHGHKISVSKRRTFGLELKFGDSFVVG